MLNQIQQATVTFSSDGKEKVSFGANCRSIRFDKSGTENTLAQIKLRVCNANNFVTNYITPKEGMQINGIDFDACEVEGTGACGVILTVSTGSFSGGGGAGATLPKEPVFDSVKATQYAEVGDTAARSVYVSPDGMQTFGGLSGNGDYSSDGIYLTKNATTDTNRITSDQIKMNGIKFATLTLDSKTIHMDGESYPSILHMTSDTIFLTASSITSNYGAIIHDDVFKLIDGGNPVFAASLTGITYDAPGNGGGFNTYSGHLEIFTKNREKNFSIDLSATRNVVNLNRKSFEMRVDTTVTPNRLVFEAI